MAVMRAPLVLALLLVSPALSGCLVKAAADVVTLPVKAVSAGVDAATTSQSEADENRGREIRKREERLGKLEREYRKLSEKCDDGDEDACDEAREVYAEMQEIMPTIPAEPDEQ